MHGVLELPAKEAEGVADSVGDDRIFEKDIAAVAIGGPDKFIAEGLREEVPLSAELGASDLKAVLAEADVVITSTSARLNDTTASGS